MKRFKIYEDNGDGVHFAVLNEKGECEYLYLDCQFLPQGNLINMAREMLNANKETNANGYFENGIENPNETYKKIVSAIDDAYQNQDEIPYDLIADENGIYPVWMGAEGQRQFETINSECECVPWDKYFDTNFKSKKNYMNDYTPREWAAMRKAVDYLRYTWADCEGTRKSENEINEIINWHIECGYLQLMDCEYPTIWYLDEGHELLVDVGSLNLITNQKAIDEWAEENNIY